MEKSNDKLSGLVLEYDSGFKFAPPYSNVFRLALDWKDSSLQVNLELHYTGREDLSEEEILEEGFTLDDDYAYKGELNPTWAKVASRQFSSTKWSGKQLTDGGITVTPIENGKMSGPKTPVDQDSWILLTHDIIQAIYEKTKRELPLTVHYRLVENDGIRDCGIQVRFSDREVIFSLADKTKTVNWEYAMELMKLIFMPDYHYDIALEKPAPKRGAYIECGDGYWHELGKGVTNIDDSYDAVGKIQEKFRDLIGENL